MSLTTEKVDYIFMYIQLFVSFFLSPCGFPGENRANLKKLFDSKSADWGGKHNTPDTQKTLLFSYQQLQQYKD